MVKNLGNVIPGARYSGLCSLPHAPGFGNRRTGIGEVYMTTIMKLVAVIAVALFFSGCSIRHVVSDDYQQYLINNKGGFQLPQTNYDAEYVLTPNTVSHNYEFRAATTGYANLWVVNFGEILEKTLQSEEVQRAFKRLLKAKDGVGSGAMTIRYNLEDYRFAGFEARVTLRISVLREGSVIFDKIYFEKGISQGGKMFWAGVFGMKNAIHQSTKNAIDKILAKSLYDIMAQDIQ